MRRTARNKNLEYSQGVAQGGRPLCIFKRIAPQDFLTELLGFLWYPFIKQKTSMKALAGGSMMETGTFATIVFVVFGVALHVIWLRNEHDKKHWVNGALLIFYGVVFLGGILTR